MIIRRATKDDVQALCEVHVQSWKETYRGIVKEQYLQALQPENKCALWSDVVDTEEVLLAEREGEVVGFTCAGRQHGDDYPQYEAELYTIYLLAKEQGKGTGERLFEAAVQSVIRQGLQSMVVFVLDENPSTQFYEKMGARKIDEVEAVIGDDVYKEAVYAWETLLEE